MSPSVVLPAPCLPALLLPGQTQFSMVTAATADDHELRNWAQRLTLRDVTDSTAVITLKLESISRPELAGLPPTARPAASLALRAGHSLALIGLRCVEAVEAQPPRHSRVFHLVQGDTIVRPRCVASRTPARDCLRIAFASDLHVAAIWDDIAGTLERFAPDLAPLLLHPGKLVERLITDLAALADRGELDALVLGGDLIDHIYQQRSGAATNAVLLLDRIAALSVPIFAIPGNHDFRLFPWRPRIYPFGAAGIPQSRAREAMRRAGLWDPWPLNPADLEAVRTRDTDEVGALDHHFANFAPASDYVVDFGELRLIFMSTGRDIIPRWRTVEPGRFGMLLRSIPVSYEHPDCEGLSEDRLAALQTALDGCRNAALFFHAPLLHPMQGTTVDPALDRIDPGDDDTPPARMRFERQLFRSGHRHGVFFRNAAPFVRTIASFDGALTAFSGHVHATHAIEFQRQSMQVRSVAIDSAHGSGVHALLNSPALGQTATRNGEPPGYLLARFEGGSMRTVERRTL